MNQQEVLTTHTIRYPSILQTTSYNFTGTKITKDQCAGVVKGAKIYRIHGHVLSYFSAMIVDKLDYSFTDGITPSACSLSFLKERKSGQPPVNNTGFRHHQTGYRLSFLTCCISRSNEMASLKGIN